MTLPYWELALTASDDTLEGLTNFLWELGALGVVEEQPAGRPAGLRAFFPGSADALRLEAGVAEYAEALSRLGFTPAGRPRIVALPEGDWAVAWREHFRPLPVGTRLRVAPPWDAPADDSRLTVLIEPARAFGTGHHATTAGCLEALERAIDTAPPPRGLDLGTGSGILAIAAARLGVGHLVAVDEDPDATAAATANAARNNVTSRVRCLTADAGALAIADCPLVVANLLSAAHRRLGPAYARYVVAGGTLILGGILDGEADELAATLAHSGFVVTDAQTGEGWTTLVLTRR